MTIETQMRQLLADEFGYDRIDRDTPLADYLDSLELVQLIGAIEETFSLDDAEAVVGDELGPLTLGEVVDKLETARVSVG